MSFDEKSSCSSWLFEHVFSQNRHAGFRIMLGWRNMVDE
jgi:hypothetical protein